MRSTENETFISYFLCHAFNETKFSTLEEEKTDALEVAEKAHEERKAKASSKSSSIVL